MRSGAADSIGGVLYLGAYSRFVTFVNAANLIFALCVSLVGILDGPVHQESMERPPGERAAIRLRRKK